MALTFGGKRRPGGTPPRTPLDPLEQRLTERIAEILRALSGSMDVDAFASAISNLDPDLLEQRLTDINVEALGRRLEDVMRSVIISGASAEAQRIMRDTPRPGFSPFTLLEPAGAVTPEGFILPTGLTPPPDVSFTVAPERPDMFRYVDQRAVDYARTRSAQLVTEIDQSNRLAIRRLITESFTTPRTADQTARQLRQVVGLHSRWAKAVTNFDQANYTRLIKDGMTPDAARARADVLTERYRAKLIRRRAEMIARTEIQQAQNYARQAAWDAGSRTGYVDPRAMKEWSTAPDSSRYGPPCPICTELRGKRVPWNGAFPSGHLMPPAHPHCRCTAVLVPPSRGLTGLPSQDLGSWLDRLDADEAADMLKHLPGKHDQKTHGHGGGTATLERRPVTAESLADAFEGTYTTDSGVEFRLVAFARQQQEIDGREVPTAGGVISVDGKMVGEWGRAVDPETGEMYALFLTVGKNINGKPIEGATQYGGKGIALAIQKRTEEVAREMGVSRIKVSATTDGIAAWAQERFGYRFAEKPHLKMDHTAGRPPKNTNEESIDIGGVGYVNGLRVHRGRDGMIYMFEHPDLGSPGVKIAVADIERRFKSDNPDDWPAPHEIISLGTGLRVHDDVFKGRTLGEWALSLGWQGVKPSSHVTKAAGDGMLWLTVEGDSDVIKHLPGKHDQKTHGHGGGSDPARGMKINPGDPSKGEEQHIEYGGMYVSTALPVMDGSSVDDARIAAYPSDLSGAATSFGYWDGNYASRVVSARVMGIEGGFKPRGRGGVVGGDGEPVIEFLHGRRSGDTLDGFDASIAQTRVRDAVILLDATGGGSAQPQLWRGLRLKDGDPRLSAQVGDEFEMPVSAFATKREDAEVFASTSFVGGLRPAAEHAQPVLIDVEPGARGYSTGVLNTPGGEEVLSQGRFRVTAVPPPESPETRVSGLDFVTRLTLKQVAHYDVIRGEWVSDE